MVVTLSLTASWTSGFTFSAAGVPVANPSKFVKSVKHCIHTEKHGKIYVEETARVLNLYLHSTLLTFKSLTSSQILRSSAKSSSYSKYLRNPPHLLGSSTSATLILGAPSRYSKNARLGSVPSGFTISNSSSIQLTNVSHERSFEHQVP